MGSSNDVSLYQAYLQDFAKRVYGMHLNQVEELAAAFISRHGLDPDEAVACTQFDEETMTWRSWIERKP